jgi:hypothetical protein
MNTSHPKELHDLAGSRGRATWPIPAGFEGLEVEELLSAGLLVGGAGAFSAAEYAGLHPDGTGKGIVIITQFEIGSPIRHAGR